MPIRRDTVFRTDIFAESYVNMKEPNNRNLHMKQVTPRALFLLTFLVSSAVLSDPAVRVNAQPLSLPPMSLSMERLAELFVKRAGRKPDEEERKELEQVLRRYNGAALVVSIASKIDARIKEQLFPKLCPKELLIEESRSQDKQRLQAREKELLARKEALDFVARNPGMAKEAFERFDLDGSLQRWLEVAKSSQYRKTLTRELENVEKQLAGETVVTKAVENRVYLSQLQKHILYIAAQEDPQIAAYLERQDTNRDPELEAKAYRIWRTKVVAAAEIEVLDPQFRESVADYVRDPVTIPEPCTILETYLQSIASKKRQ